MIVPRSRLLWSVTLLLLPLAAIGGRAPALLPAALGVGSLLLLVAAVDALLSRDSIRSITAELPVLVRMFKDRQASLEVRIVNGTQTARRLRLAIAMPDSIEVQQDDLLADLPPGVLISQVVWTCKPSRRGQYRIDGVYLEIASTLGLWSIRGHSPAKCEIRVYPTIADHKQGLAAMLRGRGGVLYQRQLGKGREFEKLREYVAGDGYDEIHWKTTAKRGHPITKVFQVERTQEVYVIIDSSRLSARPAGKDTTLELYVESALLMALAAEDQGDLFGLVTFSDQIHGFLRARNGKAHYGACREILYALHPRPVSPAFDELATFLKLRLRRRALLIVLTSLDDPVLAESFSKSMRMLGRQHLILVNTLKPEGAGQLFSGPEPAGVADIYRDLGGHLLWQGLRDTEAELRNHGMRFRAIPQESLAIQLAAQYREVKQRQLL